MRERFGQEPSADDVKWSLLNKDLMKHARRQDWGLYRNAKLEMAEILRKKSKLKASLGMYLEVCYLDLNGPNNVGGVLDKQLLKDFPPWDPKSNALLASGVIGYISQLMEQTKTDKAAAQGLFDSRITKVKAALKTPVSTENAWREIESALFNAQEDAKSVSGSMRRRSRKDT